MWFSLKIPVKTIIDGDCCGELVVINERISFYGEVDPVKGIHKPSGKVIVNKILFFPGTRGSTVGSYIIYGLKKNNTAPQCIIVEKAEPILVAGCVISNIPLFTLMDYSFNDIVLLVRDGLKTIHYRGEYWFVIEE